MKWNNWPINLFLWYPIHVLTLLICSKVVGHLEFRCSKLPSWRNRISGQREPCFSCWRSNFSMSESKLKSEFAIKRRITMGIWCAIQCRLVLLTEILLDWRIGNLTGQERILLLLSVILWFHCTILECLSYRLTCMVTWLDPGDSCSPWWSMDGSLPPGDLSLKAWTFQEWFWMQDRERKKLRAA